MSKSLQIKQMIKTFIIIVMGWIASIFLSMRIISKNAFSPDDIIDATLGGIIVGTISFWFAMSVFPKLHRRSWRLNFILLLIVRTLFYVILLFGVIITFGLATHSLQKNVSVFEILNDPKFLAFLKSGGLLSLLIFVAAASFVINFIRQINRLLGPGMLLKVIAGRYYSPVEEERIFMFLDLRSSTTIAEHLGHVKFNRLLNDFFHDISMPVLETHGEIYQYVGDEVVITWTLKHGLKNMNCLRCFFRVKKEVDSSEAKYLQKYGLVPQFKAGVHYGRVVTSEVGDLKKEIVFSGDVLNTAARIQAECNGLKKDLLVSEELMNRITIIPGYRKTNMGDFLLRGKEHSMALYAVEKD
ncbi:MAG: adenylate/guanylate cyclase domain-containing protein [Calditrichaceae bacterium]